MQRLPRSVRWRRAIMMTPAFAVMATPSAQAQPMGDMQGVFSARGLSLSPRLRSQQLQLPFRALLPLPDLAWA